MRRFASAAALASGLALLFQTAALAGSTVSGPSPYAGCVNPGEPGTVYVNAEVEPYVAVNPTTVAGGTSHTNLVGVWQQDRWNNGGAHGLAAGASFDGGKTWSETTLPFSACAPNSVVDPFTGAPYLRASDPWISFGPDGTAYTIGLLATNQNTAANNDTGIAAATSSDGGRTWGNAQLIKSDQGTSPVFEFTQFFNDKESITADPVVAGTAYAVWDRLQSPSSSPEADLFARAFRGPAWFSKTTDGGRTWTGTRAIFDPGQNNQTIGNEIVVDPRTDTLYDFFGLLTSTGSAATQGFFVAFLKSTDGGNTWSGPTVVAAQDTVGVDDPNTGANVRAGALIPQVAIDPATGQLYAVWEDARFSGFDHDEVVLSTSSDGGATWSAPARVSTPTGRPAFTPTVAVNSNGTVGVTYYDFRNLQAGNTTTLPTDYWLTTSTDHGASFGNETHVAGSFDMTTAPNAGGFFVGDYEGIAAQGKTFTPFFVAANSGNLTNRTDVFSANF